MTSADSCIVVPVAVPASGWTVKPTVPSCVLSASGASRPTIGDRQPRRRVDGRQLPDRRSGDDIDAGHHVQHETLFIREVEIAGERAPVLRQMHEQIAHANVAEVELLTSIFGSSFKAMRTWCTKPVADAGFSKLIE